MSYLRTENIVKRFDEEEVLKGLSFQISKGETLSVLGKSGCGKTTLLKVIAGLIDPSGGSIWLENRLINSIKPADRGIVYLYQEPLLFPHLNVFENIAFGLRLRKVSQEEISAKVTDMLNQLGLAEHSSKKTDQLSGGQKQRVAFGRALIINPAVLLLDEPFGNLDIEIRASMQSFFKSISEQFAITTLFVTHDLKEALLMGDRLALMDDGLLTSYESKEAFIADAKTGVSKEMAFWNQLGNSNG